MTLERLGLWIGVLVAIFTAGVGWGTNNQKIEELKEDVEKQEPLKEKAIRIEERQIRIQEDIQKILDKLEDE